MASKERITSRYMFSLIGDGWLLQRRAWLQAVSNILLLLGGLACWMLALARTTIAPINDYGLISVFDGAFYIAIACAVVLFIANISAARPNEQWMTVSIVFLIVLLHATPALLYPESRYAWTYKHIGVTDYIQREGRIDPSIDIYFNWPAFFALSAFFTEITGQSNALEMSKWMPVIWNCAYCAMIFFVFTSVSIDRRRAWIGTMLFCLTNWVGQDYFAPQPLAFLFHLALVGICIRWFTHRERETRWAITSFRPIAPLFSGRSDDSAARPLYGWAAVGAAMGAIVLGIGVVSTHQLTPFLTIISLLVLVCVGRNRLFELPFILIIATTLWVIVVALPYTGAKLAWLLQSIGTMDNILENVRPLTDQTPGRVFVAMMSRILSVSIWLLAMLGAVVRWRHGYRDTVYVLLALLPFGLFALQSYGGELIFRVYFYTLPWMILLITGLVFPAPTVKTSRRVIGAITGLCTVYSILFVCVYYGNERMNHFTPDEINASRYITDHAPSGSYVESVSGNYPRRFTRYEQLVYTPYADSVNYGNEDTPMVTLETLKAQMTQKQYPESYLVFTRSQREHVHLYGILPDGVLTQLEHDARSSQDFEVVYDTPDAVIFRLQKGATP